MEGNPDVEGCFEVALARGLKLNVERRARPASHCHVRSRVVFVVAS